MSLNANMQNLGRRHPVKAIYKAGTDENNKLKAVEVSLSLSPPPLSPLPSPPSLLNSCFPHLHVSN